MDIMVNDINISKHLVEHNVINHNNGTNTHAQIDALIAASSSFTLIEKYDTGWVSNNDWTSQKLGTAVNGNVVHNLNAQLSQLLVKIFISTDGTDDNSFELTVAGEYPASYGLSISQVNSNNILIACAQTGILRIDPATYSYVTIDTEAWYYKIVVYKPYTGTISYSPLASFNYTIDSAALALNQFQTIAHSLGARPNRVQVSLVCISADLGWAVGDEIFIENNHYNPAAGSTALWSVGADATNFYTSIYNAANTFLIMQKSDGVFNSATMSRWKFRIRYGL